MVSTPSHAADKNGQNPATMTDDLTLSIDLGTSSVRAALVDRRGTLIALASRGFAQTVPRFGWAEQSASAWWEATVAAIREVLAAATAPVVAVCACGQMHGTVLVAADGSLASDRVLLWNDKRSTPEVEAWEAAHPFSSYAQATANPATPAWPGFKLAWLKAHAEDELARTATVLTPKDFINLRLSGVATTDWSEASASFMADSRTGGWSGEIVAALGLRRDLLPPIFAASDVIGEVSAEAAAATGLPRGIPVLAGGGDLPVALIGSGAATPGLGSDIAGTSAIATLVRTAPLIDPAVANVAAPGGMWGAFTLVDAGGDAIRWASHAIGNGVPESAAEAAEAGSGGLFFLPFLSGDRMPPARNARAQFFGLTTSHGKAEMNRAVLEGIAFALHRQFEPIARLGGRPERFVAAGGGSRSDLWLRIKASVYSVPILVPRALESGVIGCAILSRQALGEGSLAELMGQMTAIEREVLPVPAWADRYARMLPVYGRIVEAMRPLYDELDGLRE
jgi:xylulokinase